MDKIIIDRKERAANVIKHWVRLTRICNNHCIFCLDAEAQNGSCISIEDIKKDLALGIKNNATKVILSGGEPTLRPDFIEIIKLTRSTGFQDIQVISNGRLFIYKDFLMAAVKAGVSEVTFSMHGHTDTLHDKQTQVSGSFHQSLTGLKNALTIKDLIVSIDIVINKINVEYLADILKFYIKLGAHEFDLLQVIPFGQAWDNKERLFYDLDSYYDRLEQAFRLSRNPNIYIWTNRFPSEYLEGFEDLIQSSAKLYDEVGGRKAMFNNFLLGRSSIACRGTRCDFCFLKGFCTDLVELKKRGRLAPRLYPACLKEFDRSIDSNKSISKYIWDKDNKKGILKFLGYYIKYRYFIKSLRCKNCNLNGSCAGMQHDYIRRNGFKALQPVLIHQSQDK